VGNSSAIEPRLWCHNRKKVVDARSKTTNPGNFRVGSNSGRNAIRNGIDVKK